MTPTEALLAEDPLWLTALKVVVVFVFLMVMTLFMIWMEHRVLGRMQHRPGPNRVGPFGLLQSLADGLELAFKGRYRDGGRSGASWPSSLPGLADHGRRGVPSSVRRPSVERGILDVSAMASQRSIMPSVEGGDGYLSRVPVSPAETRRIPTGLMLISGPSASTGVFGLCHVRPTMAALEPVGK
jgi:NADH dehydrogenase